MFGYVRPAMERLTDVDKARFGAAYCGLCRALGQRYGQAARMILNYDLTFLSILLWPEDVEPEALRRGCAAHPVTGRDYYPGNPALELSADESVILSWQRIQDVLADPGRGKGKYRAAALALKGAYGKARERRPAFDAAAREQLERLRAMEDAGCPSLDEPADAFAKLLSAAAEEAEDPVKRRILEHFLYHLGRWIYLVDAADDLAEDFRSGSYNPLILRYGLRKGELDGEARKELASTLDHSIRLMAAAYELGEFGVWNGIIQSTVYEGLFTVGSAVLAGTFQARDTMFCIAGRNKEQL